MPASPMAPPRNAGRSRQGPAQPAAPIPFTAAAHEHTEPAFDVSIQPGAAAANLGPFDVPAYGFMRHLFLEITATGGVAGPGVASADFPYNIFQSIALNDVNGAPIFGPLDGYATLWTNIIGGYAFQMDPRRLPWYSTSLAAPVFGLRIPVEISHHDGFGALANQNAAASYKIALTLNPAATIWSTLPTTAPTLRIRGYLEAWSVPNETDVRGRPQAQLPPAHGSTQYWSQFVKSMANGNNTVLLPRVGNLIRNLVFIARDATGARVDTVFPNPATLQWDARSLLQDTQNYRIALMFERLNNVLTRDTGVFAYQFDHSVDNLSGDDAPTLWLPTVQSSRLELDGNNTAAGTLQVLTNDIAPVEVVPSERFVEPSATGFHPESGVGPPRVS